MKWKEVTHGCTRARCRFLLFPKLAAGEWRWLESACFIQKYIVGWWWIKAWITREQYEEMGRGVFWPKPDPIKTADVLGEVEA